MIMLTFAVKGKKHKNRIDEYIPLLSLYMHNEIVGAPHHNCAGIKKERKEEEAKTLTNENNEIFKCSEVSIKMNETGYIGAFWVVRFHSTKLCT